MPVVIAVMTPNVSLCKFTINFTKLTNGLHYFQGSREEWSHVFLMFGGLFSAAALIFVLTGSAARQKWADPQPKKDAADVKLPR